jgi:hypothetical protein
VPRAVGELTLLISLHSILLEYLHDLSVGTCPATVGLQPQKSLVEKPDYRFIRVIRRLDRKPIKGIG